MENNFNRLVDTKYGPMLINRNDQYVGNSLAAYGEYSEGEVDLFSQILKPGDVVVEAGSNIGAHTVVFSRLVGNQGVVYAFEPQRIVFQTLCANLALNQCINVIARQEGLGSQKDELCLPVTDPRLPNNFGGQELIRNGAGERVRIDTIDSLFLQKCSLIKADVEGMEEAVISGAVGTINRFRPILYLENDRQDKSASLISLILKLGYRIWWDLVPLFNPENFAGNNQNIFEKMISVNMLCQPAETAFPVAGMREVLDEHDSWNQAW